MIILRATKSLLKEMNSSIDPLPANDLGDLNSWHANNFTMNRRKHLIFMNDHSRLSITVSGIKKNEYKDIKRLFRDSLLAYLMLEGIKESVICSYMAEMEDLLIANTNNRSVLGTITEAIKLMEYSNSESSNSSNDDLNKENNRIIYKPIDYLKPIDVFNEALNKQFA